jgi:hypothetical protein
MRALLTVAGTLTAALAVAMLLANCTGGLVGLPGASRPAGTGFC